MTELDIIADAITLAFAFFMLMMFLLLFALADRLQRLLDRYRLKYSFDREIESKEISKEDTELKLNKREQKFKRRVFKD